MSASCLHTVGVQCLYYMLCLKRMVCNVRAICYVWNEWCAMFVLHVMLEMNGVQCLYYMLCLKWMVCNACTMCYVWNEWCAVCVYYLLHTLWYWGKCLHMYYSCTLSSCKIDYMMSLRAHFYNTIARKHFYLAAPHLHLFTLSHCPLCPHPSSPINS